MSEYQNKLTAYARKLWAQKGNEPYPVDAVGGIEATKGWDGCDTCGFGDGAGVFVYLGGVEVGEFSFSSLGTVIQGILES